MRASPFVCHERFSISLVKIHGVSSLLGEVVAILGMKPSVGVSKRHFGPLCLLCGFR